MLTDCDIINKLSYCMLTGSGVKDGRIVLLTLEHHQKVRPVITHEFEEYTEIGAQCAIELLKII